MKKQLISVAIDTGTYKSFIDRLILLAQSGISSYTCVANVHMIVEAYLDSSFAKVVNNADLVTPDGMPLTWGLKLIHGSNQDRVAGMDLLPDLLNEASKKGMPVFFYGGSDKMIKKTEVFLKDHFPDLQIAGMHSPPFRALTETEESCIVSMINSSNAKIVFVVLGCPKQEKWMASMKGRINALMIGIGGALPVLIGIQKRAPRWMQLASLEWLYRLLQEPKRLFKRYLLTNSIYLWLLVNEFFLKRKYKSVN